MTKEFESLKEEGNKKFEYVDIAQLIKELDENIFTLCSKIQPYTKSKYLHLISVKTFVERKKTVLALKSLNFLKNQYSDSVEFEEGSRIFNEYISKETLNETLSNLIKELNVETTKSTINEEKISIRDQLKLNLFKNNFKENENLISELIKDANQIKHLSFKVNLFLIFNRTMISSTFI